MANAIVNGALFGYIYIIHYTSCTALKPLHFQLLVCSLISSSRSSTPQWAPSRHNGRPCQSRLLRSPRSVRPPGRCTCSSNMCRRGQGHCRSPRRPLSARPLAATVHPSAKKATEVPNMSPLASLNMSCPSCAQAASSCQGTYFGMFTRTPSPSTLLSWLLCLMVAGVLVLLGKNGSAAPRRRWGRRRNR